jgi:hypothetical protein
MTLLAGFRLMNVGEFIPHNAKYLSVDGIHWHDTPVSGKQIVAGDPTVWACPETDSGTRVGESAGLLYSPIGFPFGTN